jgi:hypothetical protein
MNKKLIVLLLAGLMSALPFSQSLPARAVTHAAVVVASALRLFDTEAAAQRHCPSDVIVWLNTKTGIFHEKGMRWYGRTREGAYVCRREALADGDRDTRNGQ